MPMAGAVRHAADVGATAFALFVKSSQTWAAKPLLEEDCNAFKDACKEYGYGAGGQVSIVLALSATVCLSNAAVAPGRFSPQHILPHGSYLVNLGSPKPEVVVKSKISFKEELSRCHRLGLSMLNIHPGLKLPTLVRHGRLHRAADSLAPCCLQSPVFAGSTCGQMTPEQCIRQIAAGINEVMSEVPEVSVVLENTAGGGGTIGASFAEIASLIALIEDKDRHYPHLWTRTAVLTTVGVCLDTCHLFAAGHDIRTPDAFDVVMDEFDQQVGTRYLRGLHLNDSKGSLGCCLDRHENLGKGHLGLHPFAYIMKHPALANLPMILETPQQGLPDAEEIRMLHALGNGNMEPCPPGIPHPDHAPLRVKVPGPSTQQ
eukprot:gene8826-1582_t